LLEREDGGRGFRNARHLDPVDRGHHDAAHRLDERVVGLRAGREGRPRDAPERGIAHEREPRAGLEALGQVGAAADRAARELGALGFDDLARHGAPSRVGQRVDERRIGARQADLERARVERLQSRDRRRVVETALLAARGRDQVVEALDQPLEVRPAHRDARRVGDPLHAVDEVLRDELARLAAERRVRREQEPRPEAQRVGASVGGHLRQRLRRVRDHAHRPCEVVVGEELVVERRDRVERRQAARARRVEHLDVGEHLQAQDLLGGERAGRRGERECAGRDEGGGSPGEPAAARHFASPSSFAELM